MVLYFSCFCALFGGVIMFRAPYLPTLNDQQKIAFELLKLQKEPNSVRTWRR
jgi:hypothetical protein